MQSQLLLYSGILRDMSVVKSMRTLNVDLHLFSRFCCSFSMLFNVQAHHDYCNRVLSEYVTHAIHEFEDTCDGCIINRKHNENLDDCPSYDCSSSTEVEAAIATLNTSACSDCSSDACKAAFKKLRAAHDGCDHDDVPMSVENALHDFEDTCRLANADCNVKDLPEEPVCAAQTAMAGTLLLAAAALAAAVF
eukprot:TRINITY_DN9153_c0_g1_i1.p2 TRINITY_DN9153_c0_g1~~TRINITY_DN9153_c0_g1_i1.p2  ORF type:complete len:192 (-),score=46.74 TRINITY_DN9153_c0_g1_i1:1956-2531(-)